MRQVKRWRYYCDFCKKSGSQSGAMRKHEKGCTRNPNRECGMCRYAEHSQTPLDELKPLAAVAKEVYAVALAEWEAMPGWSSATQPIPDLVALTKAADDCPACILAAIVQERMGRGKTLGDGNEMPYDFKAVATKFLDDHHEEAYY